MRFDDPSERWGTPQTERYRVFYCATERFASFVESFDYAKRKPGIPSLAERISAFVLDADDDPFEETRPIIPNKWFETKRLACATPTKPLTFVDLASDETLAALNSCKALKKTAREQGYPTITEDAIRSGKRRLTQEIAYTLYGVADDGGEPVAGIRYISRFPERWECWALFDTRVRNYLLPTFPGRIEMWDLIAKQAARYHNALFEDGRGVTFEP